jgi:hypothetical protein
MSVNIKVMHPTNNSDIDIGVPDNMLLGEVFVQLIEAKFLSCGQDYSAVNNSQGNKPLNNKRTVFENGIKNSDIILTVLSTKAGGFDIVQLWDSIYPYLDQIGTVAGLLGSGIGFGLWIKNKFSKTSTPDTFIDILTQKELWNVHECALLFQIEDDEAKKLLKGFGYKWNRKLLYM